MRLYPVLWAGLALGLGMTALLLNVNPLAEREADPESLHATGPIMNVETQRHFRALLPPRSVDVVNVIRTAQELDYWIRLQAGEDVTYLKGERRCSACDPAREDAFFKPPQLYVDGQHFWIRLHQPQWWLNLRPSPSPDTARELIISPKLPQTEITPDDLEQIRATLQPFGLLPAPAPAPAQTAPLELEPLIPPAKPVPPEDAPLDSVLYGLTQAPDWLTYARANRIELSGLRAEIIIELSSPDASLPGGFDLVVEARSGGLVRAQALIHRLVDLSRAPSVAWVRLPSRPHPAAAGLVIP